MKVVILAGGFGTRLRSVVSDVPKSMAEINGRPFLELLMDYLLFNGADEFVLCVSYLKEIIINHFGSSYKGVPVKYSVESEPLGTGGAIKQAFDMFDIDEALVLNGDTFIKTNYRQFYQKMKNSVIGMGIKHVTDTSRYGSVRINNSKIIEFIEKQQASGSGIINAGVYYVSKKLWQKFNYEGTFSFEKDVLEKIYNKVDISVYRTNGYFIDIGLPQSYSQACQELENVVYSGGKAVFLDRDGVINDDLKYVHKIEDCHFIKGIFDFCRKAKEKKYKLIVITNQAGIAKGFYSKNDYFKFRGYVHEEFKKQKCPIDKEYYCPYHPDGQGKYKKNSFCRKPNPGLIYQAQKDLKINLRQSILIGDKESDILAAKNSGIGLSIQLVGKYETTDKADLYVKNLAEIVI